MLERLKAWLAQGRSQGHDRISTFGADTPSPVVVTHEDAPPLRFASSLVMHEGYPMLDAQAADTWLQGVCDGEPRARARGAIERGWLLHLREALGVHFRLVETGGVSVVSSLEDNVVAATLDFVARTSRRIRRVLKELAKDTPDRHVLVVFDDDDSYYRYVAYYYPEDGVYAPSGGMFIDAVCSHFVTVKSDLRAIEPVIAHEMTHAALAHLPLPLWLNEGLAVNIESRLSGASPAPHTPGEMNQMHRAYWNVSTIKQFWSGDAFHDAGEGVTLAYDLARILVEQLSRDWGRFKQFVRTADFDDSGAAAARTSLSIELGNAVCALLERETSSEWSPRTRTTVHAFDSPNEGMALHPAVMTSSGLTEPGRGAPFRKETTGEPTSDFSSLVGSRDAKDAS